jgi:hypothetical protein
MADCSAGMNPNGVRVRREQNEEVAEGARPNLKDPCVVLSLLEADQVVAAKSQTHFGRRELSFGVRVMLWGLRVYVVLMMVIVAISVIRAFHSLH